MCDAEAMRLIATTLSAPIVLALVGCAGPTSPPLTPTAEQRFEQAVITSPQYTPSTNAGANTRLVENGRGVCAVMDTPGSTEKSIIISFVLVGYSRETAELITAAAVDNLCPGKTWPDAAPPAAIIPSSLPSVTVQPIAPEGPLTAFDDGLYEVGIDVAAGRYKTSGSSGCYWARLKSSDTGDIISNNFGAGPQTAQIRAGEYFQSQRCGTWSRTG